MKIIFLGLLLNLSAFAKLPTIPQNCFSEKVYCSTWEVLQDETTKKFIRINFFAELSKDLYPSYQDIEKLYMNFPEWIEYGKDSTSIKITLSREADHGVNSDELPFLSHEAHYVLRGPPPVNWVKVKEITVYQKIHPVDNALSSWLFDLKKDYPALEGVKGKKGELHITFNEEKNVYEVFVIVDIYPAIAILHKLAAPYMEAGFVSMFLGMFDLN